MKLRMSLAAPVAAMALALSALAGCGESTDTGGATTVGPLDPNKKVEITWWHGQSAEAAKILGDLAREYEKDHPNVTIKDSAGDSHDGHDVARAPGHLPRETTPAELRPESAGPRDVGVIVVAAGSGSRTRQPELKQFSW